MKNLGHFDYIPIVMMFQKVKEDWWKWALGLLASLLLLGINDKLSTVRQDTESFKKAIEDHIKISSDENKTFRDELYRKIDRVTALYTEDRKILAEQLGKVCDRERNHEIKLKELEMYHRKNK